MSSKKVGTETVETDLEKQFRLSFWKASEEMQSQHRLIVQAEMWRHHWDAFLAEVEIDVAMASSSDLHRSRHNRDALGSERSSEKDDAIW